jgi:uncharacterized membrane protein
MAQCRRELKAALALALAALLIGHAPAQNTTTPVALSTPAGKKKPQREASPAGPPGKLSPELENVRKALEALTPEQREQFRQNFARWISLTADDKKSLRDLQEIRRKHMQDEIEEAITQSGLQLDPERRQMFVKRYTEERKKIEEALRKETEERRGPRLEELRNRLKAEFSAPAPSR